MGRTGPIRPVLFFYSAPLAHTAVLKTLRCPVLLYEYSPRVVAHVGLYFLRNQSALPNSHQSWRQSVAPLKLFALVAMHPPPRAHVLGSKSVNAPDQSLCSIMTQGSRADKPLGTFFNTACLGLEGFGHELRICHVCGEDTMDFGLFLKGFACWSAGGMPQILVGAPEVIPPNKLLVDGHLTKGDHRRYYQFPLRDGLQSADVPNALLDDSGRVWGLDVRWISSIADR